MTNSTACFNRLCVVCPVFMIRVDVEGRKTVWCSLLPGHLCLLWEEKFHLIFFGLSLRTLKMEANLEAEVKIWILIQSLFVI